MNASVVLDTLKFNFKILTSQRLKMAKPVFNFFIALLFTLACLNTKADNERRAAELDNLSIELS